MKYVLSLVAGIIIGALMFAAGLYYNPFTAQQAISPLAVTDDQVLELGFTSVPNESILYTNDGESAITPHPERVSDLWEPAVADTSVFVTELLDARGELAGIGIKSSTASEATDLLFGKALMSSVWHVYVPGRGTFVMDQSENYWSYLRQIVIPARWSGGDSWKGNIHGITTDGPGALGTARISGGSGDFAGMASEAIESFTAKAYSATEGPVYMTGSLTITLPQASSQTEQ